MIENAIPASGPEPKAGGPGCLAELGWLFSGAVLPLGSFTFYRKAAKRSVGSAILFFLFFTVTLATLSTINIGVVMFSLIGGIQQAYADGEVPEIVISNGVAQVDGPQPFIFADESTPATQPVLVAVDTTGQITEIDRRRYTQGFLLTRTELHMLDQQGQYQTVPLSDINIMFERDPIVINAESVSSAWSVMSTAIVLIMFIFLILWHTVVRLMYIAMAALIMWGVVSMLKPNTGFGPVIVTGLYAVIPAIYFSHLFTRSGLGIPGLQTLFLMIFWTIGLVACLTQIHSLPDDQPLRLWTAFVGLPMLILYIVDMFWQIPAPYGSISLWAVTVLTTLALTGLRLFLRFNKPSLESPAA